MKTSSRTLLTTGVLFAGLVVLSGADAGGPALRESSPALEPATPAALALVSAVRPPRLLEALQAAARSQPPTPFVQPPKYPVPPWPGVMHVGMEVLVAGKPLPTVSYHGKTYLPIPTLGTEYEIRIWNHGPRRVVAIVSVDGLSVINGQPASEAHPGYVVAPYSPVVIKGWRRSMETVAAFRFVEHDRSYAALVGRPENVGVIGLIAIEEQVPYLAPALERKDSTAIPAKAAFGQVGSAGTEYGREVDSGIYYVSFNRSSNKRTITFYYDTVEALRAAGIPVDGPAPVPFPADPPFAPPPPGYQGK
jgi:hypothetical protein